jgi:hypothetical protein
MVPERTLSWITHKERMIYLVEEESFAMMKPMRPLYFNLSLLL